jgi:peptide/nickel transport system ATP-binding protein
MTENQQNNNGKPVLQVQNLRVHYATPTGDVIAVSDISFDLFQGETLGLVGESGCGKTTAAYGLLRLVQPPGYIVHGEVQLDDTNLITLDENSLRDLRWTRLALIPQGAMNSLNPTMRVKKQISDAIEAHTGKQSEEKLKERIFELFQMVGLPNRIYNMYPHELSGGMKQRVCIAMSIALNPSVIIADEATSALDVVVQRVVAQTLLKVKAALGVSMIVIGHDMGLLAQLVDRMAVMYAGKIVEIAPVSNIYKKSHHPYTQLLIDSIPSIKERKPLKITEGITHDPRNPPSGCIFRLRCPHAWEHCSSVEPAMITVGQQHDVACHLYDEQFAERRANVNAALGNS